MFEIVIILLLIALNGLFAMSELAVVSARRTRVRGLADAGVWGARRALSLAAEPGRFLSTVQIGITMIGVIAGAFSGATLGRRVSAWFLDLGVGTFAAEWLGFGIVITAVTFMSIIFGELIPKQLALIHPERIACRVAPLMTMLSAAAWPAAWVLQVTTRGVFRLVGFKGKSDDTVSEEEMKALIAEAEQSGVIEASEKQMIAGVLRLGARPVMGVMTPRTEVQWINLNMSEADIVKAVANSSHSRLPACEGTIDAMVGVIQVRELLKDLIAGRAVDVRAHMRQATVIPSTADALDALAKLRSAEVPMAMIHNEYGDFEGLVTPADLLEAIAGSFRSHDEGEEDPNAVRRADGSWLLAGSMPADEMADHLAFTLPEGRDYQTLAGFALAQFKRLPAAGETFEAHGWHFEVVDLDGRRIDKVIVSRLPVRRARVVQP